MSGWEDAALTQLLHLSKAGCGSARATSSSTVCCKEQEIIRSNGVEQDGGPKGHRSVGIYCVKKEIWKNMEDVEMICR